MAKRIVLVTGSLAEPRVKRIAEELNDAELEPVVANIGVKVAALMTAEIVERRLKLPDHADRVILPGRFRGDLERLSNHFGTRFERGPEEIADLPAYLGQTARDIDLSEQDVTIFGEIVDATLLTPEQIVERSRKYRADGADVIDLGCLPDSPFPASKKPSRLCMRTEPRSASIPSTPKSYRARHAPAQITCFPCRKRQYRSSMKDRLHQSSFLLAQRT